MQNSTDVTAAALRAEVSPVSERFAAFEFGSDLVIFDRDDPDRWLLADCAVGREEMR